MKGTDYSRSGKTIQGAMLDHGQRNPSRPRGPLRIRWGEHLIQTADVIACPTRGRVRIRFLRYVAPVVQAVELRMRSGGCILQDGSMVPLLRTVADERFEDTVEYSYVAQQGEMSVWNSYEVRRGAHLIWEHWTGNAGMWVEEKGPTTRIYHCSPGLEQPPDFEALVFELHWEAR